MAGGLSLAADPATDVARGKSGLVGDWRGTLDVGAIKLRLNFTFKESATGEVTGVLESVDQGGVKAEINPVTITDGKVRAEVKQIRAVFEGTLDKTGETLDGTFTQGPSPLPLVLRHGAPIKLARPQEPAKPYPYREEEVTFENKSAGARLAGTLTLPQTKGPFPAVVLISGSGAQDRDESLLGHKPFLILADHLTRQGYAVLRYDDRGVGKSTGDFLKATSEDFKGDALAGVAFLKSRGDIDPRQIGLCGHSEGGLIAPWAAAESPDVAFIVLMAGTGVPGREIMVRQIELIIRAGGASEEEVKQAVKQQKDIFAMLESSESSEMFRAKVAMYFDRELSEEQKKDMEKSAGSAEASLKQIESPWYRLFLAYDPRTSLVKVKCPVLAINGQLDTQVDPQQNLPEIAKALKTAGNRDVTLVELPGLNHLFQTCKTGSPSEYGQIEETFSPAALKAISDWLNTHTKR